MFITANIEGEIRPVNTRNIWFLRVEDALKPFWNRKKRVVQGVI
jgi:hypothetical protein